MERATKRRRLSLEDEDGYSASGHGDSSHSDRNEPMESPRAIDTTSISRIKAKTRIANSVPTPDPPRGGIDSSTDSHYKPPFSSLDIAPWLTHSLSALSITTPTRIQTSCVPPILRGEDCIGSSRTGSGKTLAFALPILQKWAESPSSIFAVILTPTRELALQIYEQIVALGSGQGLKVALVTGGADRGKQARELEERPGVVVATPGRLADFVLNEGEGSEIVRSLGRVKVVVLDEGDRLLAPGTGSMVGDLETCFNVFPAPEERQTLLFTATVTPEVRAMKAAPRAKGRREVFICEVDTKALAIPQTLKQTYQLVNVLHKEKYLHILLLTPVNLKRNIIIFCNRTSTATLLEYMLRLLEHRVTSLHSGLQHKERVANLAKFRARVARILIATDLASRGLDIPSVELVVNYDLPRNPEDYIHRVGRTARAARKGTSISLVGQRDVELVHAIEARVGGQMEEYAEEGVSVEGRVVRDALNLVSEKKREAMLNLEEGRDVRGKRRRGEMRKKGR